MVFYSQGYLMLFESMYILQSDNCLDLLTCTLLHPATLGESSPLDDRSPPVRYGPNRQSPTPTINRRPQPSIADPNHQSPTPTINRRPQPSIADPNHQSLTIPVSCRPAHSGI